ncbi:PREDICTED: histone-lysine N-methyltransferase SETMAR-like [Dinoponera quadriceps]|uniref:Histone-lysine N-methyltransferase SETMAR-like n=1 Tax=Dinoponera quadriceps TaxID=609295 RepID=A0A6P3YD42_DINQU|nr:PREDICTED: histone-lysine N-methyltransferase SETMAR-like [Dinoponera quadriceps]
MLCFIALKKIIVQRTLQTRLCTVYGSGTTTIRTVRNRFKRFRAGNFDLKDEDRSGRPATMDTEFFKAMLAENPRYCVRELVDATNIPRTTCHMTPHLQRQKQSSAAVGGDVERSEEIDEESTAPLGCR